MIQLRQISYQYPGQTTSVLNDMDLNIQRGSITVLAGSNGSGKTTLLKIIGGLVPKFSGGSLKGRRTWDGEEYGSIHPQKIGMVLHGIDQHFIQARVDQEIFHILETNGYGEASIRDAFDRCVHEWNLQFILHKNISDLSSGEIQIFKIALAFLLLPELVLMDEPLSFLDPHWRNFMLNKFRQINSDRHTAFVITDHDPATWRTWSESVRVVHLDSLQTEEPPKADVLKIRSSKDSLINIQNLNFSYGDKAIIKGLSQSISRGEIVGIYGSNGVGKTTLLRLLKNHLQPSNGSIRFHPQSPRIRMLGFPTLQTFFSMKVRDEIRLNQTSTSTFQVEKHSNKFVFDLSSGEQRKVALECILSDQTDLLLLDEPFLHLDPLSKNILTESLKKISEKGVAIILTSQDQNAISYVCDQTWRLE